mmetsp:Transcript_23578/g.50292  ORF Transcript_23578/g.50292 Transcript_23578/m.50292 type:complete len:127 (-) Transcript_23578:336-716(-)|eukprot:CAMPEP_0206537286 /NCGR_PEP_ID=MMETSP0325_2-20121206/7235_1 /ASSEMBLY_ACC=CAM_ASM_000347 /TAXON_ID=2866 /ORGANISM="Crypthecodinium cohnii, Strain Seligo" /LENGTH=126 /DNA_ID=CAMNT_0054034621 /DNA_START=1355 /DNA_END=1735 /DNA_ORIENTATION=-
MRALENRQPSGKKLSNPLNAHETLRETARCRWSIGGLGRPQRLPQTSHLAGDDSCRVPHDPHRRLIKSNAALRSVILETSVDREEAADVLSSQLRVGASRRDLRWQVDRLIKFELCSEFGAKEDPW